MVTRRIPLSSTYNTRDIGGYFAGDGYMTKWKVIIRSDVPAFLSERDINLLREYNLRLVIDLRAPDQINLKSSALMDVSGIEYTKCSFKNGNRTPKYKKDVINIFKELLSDYGNIAKIMRLIIRTDGAVLFHCTAGKDRTGVIIALLLSLAGVSKEDIVADYSMSYSYIRPIIRDIKKATSGLPEWYGVTYPEIMEAVLEYIGNSFDYLLNCGLTEEEIVKLKKHLLDEENRHDQK